MRKAAGSRVKRNSGKGEVAGSAFIRGRQGRGEEDGRRAKQMETGDNGGEKAAGDGAWRLLSHLCRCTWVSWKQKRRGEDYEPQNL